MLVNFGIRLGPSRGSVLALFKPSGGLSDSNRLALVCVDIFTWLAFGRYFILKISVALDTLRVANRSPTPASKISDFLGLFDDIWGVRGRLSGPIWGIPGVRVGITSIYF